MPKKINNKLENKKKTKKLKSNKNNIIKKAIDIVGSASKLAKEMGVSISLISTHTSKHKQITPRLALKLEKVTQGKITRKECLPDLFEGYTNHP